MESDAMKIMASTLWEHALLAWPEQYEHKNLTVD
jgi:hypothetical protein